MDSALGHTSLAYEHSPVFRHLELSDACRLRPPPAQRLHLVQNHYGRRAFARLTQKILSNGRDIGIGERVADRKMRVWEESKGNRWNRRKKTHHCDQKKRRVLSYQTSMLLNPFTAAKVVKVCLPLIPPSLFPKRWVRSKKV